MKKFLFAAAIFYLTLLTTAHAQTNIRAIDFQNFTYQPFCGDQVPLGYTVKDGTFFKETVVPVVLTKKEKKRGVKDTRIEREYFNVYQTIYADLSGDGIEEAIILSVCTRSGPESFTEGFIYGLMDGVPELLVRIPGGDRASGGIRNVSVGNGLIVVERSTPGDSGDVCCPERMETTSYKFENLSISQVGEKTVREIYPPTRIDFTEGTVQTAFDLEISKDSEINRFTVSGRKGQILTVSTSSEDAKIRLKKGKAQLEGSSKKLPYITKNTMVAKLQENGDFVFEITNFSRKNLNVTVTVEIK